MDRLYELCEKILEIKSESENYIGLYESNRLSPNTKETKFYLIKDGATHASLYDLSYEDYLLLQDAKILDGRITPLYKDYAVFALNCDKVIDYLENYAVDQYDNYLNKKDNK